MNETRKTYIDHEVTNEHLETIGRVTDVLYDSSGDDEPKWLVVKPGILQAERYVPIDRSYETEDGHIVVPFDKRWIKAAPKARDHIITPDIEHKVVEHYNVSA